MSTQGIDYTGYPAFIHNNEGESISRTMITGFEKVDKHISLKEFPSELDIGDTCKILILSEPTPREYLGRVKNEYGEKIIALFQGQDSEKRGATRYKVNFSAFIENLIYSSKTYKLYQPIEIQLVNISTGGMRFKAPPNTISPGDKFQTRIFIKLDVKVLIAQVVNSVQKDENDVEYGCRFLGSAKTG